MYLPRLGTKTVETNNNFKLMNAFLYFHNKKSKKTAMSKQALELVKDFLFPNRMIVTAEGNKLYIYTHDGENAVFRRSCYYQEKIIKKCIMTEDNTSIVSSDVATNKFHIYNIKSNTFKGYNMVNNYGIGVTLRNFEVSQTGKYILFATFLGFHVMDTQTDERFEFDIKTKHYAMDTLNFSMFVVEDEVRTFIAAVEIEGCVHMMFILDGKKFMKTMDWNCTVGRTDRNILKISPDHKTIMLIDTRVSKIFEVDFFASVKTEHRVHISTCHVSQMIDFYFLDDNATMCIKMKGGADHSGRCRIVLYDYNKQRVYLCPVHGKQPAECLCQYANWMHGDLVNNNHDFVWEVVNDTQSYFTFLSRGLADKKIHARPIDDSCQYMLIRDAKTFDVVDVLTIKFGFEHWLDKVIAVYESF